MAIREIDFTVTANGIDPASRQFGGIQGEHNATKLVFTLDSDFYKKINEQKNNDKQEVVYRFEGFDCIGGMRATLPKPIEESLSYSLENWLTKEGGTIRIHLVISLINDSETLVDIYTFPAILQLKENPKGIPKEPENYDSIPTLARNAEVNAKRAGLYAQRAEEAAIKQPIVGENKNWLVWSAEINTYVDTGVSAEGPKGEDGSNYFADETEFVFLGGNASNPVLVEFAIDEELSSESPNPVQNKVVGKLFNTSIISASKNIETGIVKEDFVTSDNYIDKSKNYSIIAVKCGKVVHISFQLTLSSEATALWNGITIAAGLPKPFVSGQNGHVVVDKEGICVYCGVNAQGYLNIISRETQLAGKGLFGSVTYIALE